MERASTKRVVFINGRFLTQRVTGVQRYARESLIALDDLVSRHKPNFELVVLAPPGTEPPELKAIEFRIVGRRKGNVWEQVELPLYVRERLLYSFSATGPLLKAGQVVTIHDASIHAVPDAFSVQFRLWYKFALAVLGRRSKRVITVSDFSARELARYYGCRPNRITRTTEGWQHLLRQAPDRSIIETHGLKPRGFLLAVSSPTPNKNFALIAKALQLLRDLTFQVVIAGHSDKSVFGGGARPESPFIKYVGYVTDAQLRALYENAAIFVFPSRYEGFGLPVIEAMASGCPVISSNTASLPEVCGDAAELVDPDDAQGLASKISALMANEDRRREMSVAGLARSKEFSWERAASEHLACIDELMSAERSKRQ